MVGRVGDEAGQKFLHVLKQRRALVTVDARYGRLADIEWRRALGAMAARPLARFGLNRRFPNGAAAASFASFTPALSLSSQFDTSPLCGKPGSSTIRTLFATGSRLRATCSACWRPGASLSGRI